MDIFKNAQKAWLVLADGTVYEGLGLGCAEDAIGEIVFNTSVVGYQEILTDPANANNIVVDTFPLAGNYGVNPEHELHDDMKAKGWVVREWCLDPSNFRCEGRIDQYLEEKKISAIFDVDTRAITRKIRDKGVMNALITRKNPLTNMEEIMAQLAAWKAPLPAWVEYNDKVTFNKLDAKYNITMLNYGIRSDVIRALLARNANITVVPHTYTEKQVLETKPDAVVLCGGAGLESLRTSYEEQENVLDAAEETVAALMKSGVPVLGIDLGHQLMALSMGGTVEKMSCGHRGANCPVTETATGRTFITSQNHGYLVKDIPNNAEVSHINANDKTCEGLTYRDMKAFSVQFIPESELGRKNFDGVYEKLLNMIG